MQSLVPVFETVLNCMDVASVFCPQIFDLSHFASHFLFKMLIYKASYHSFYSSKVIIKSARKRRDWTLSISEMESI